MTRYLPLLAFVLLFCSCNNGDYDADPNTNFTTSPNVSCPLTAADTICSCTDSLSFYSNGALYSYSQVVAVHSPDNDSNVVFGSLWDPNNTFDISTDKYTGPGTYTIGQNDMGMSIGHLEDSLFYGADTYQSECSYIKLVITEDNGTIVKGTFYGIVERDTSDGEINYYTVYRTIKGGRFVARWIN